MLPFFVSAQSVWDSCSYVTYDEFGVYQSDVLQWVYNWSDVPSVLLSDYAIGDELGRYDFPDNSDILTEGEYVDERNVDGDWVTNANGLVCQSLTCQPCADTDGDDVCDTIDNCPDDFNPWQEDNNWFDDTSGSKWDACELYCGDGSIQTPNDLQFNEECDGSSIPAGTPSEILCTNCDLVWSCWDSYVDTAGAYGAIEECDDGANGDNSDGCSDTCEFTYSVCNINNSACTFSINDTLPLCDAAVDIDNDSIPDACDDQICGNGTQEWTEWCDDGNSNNDDACANDCTQNQTRCNATTLQCEYSSDTSLPVCDESEDVDNDWIADACDPQICGNDELESPEECDTNQPPSMPPEVACTSCAFDGVCWDNYADVNGIYGAAEECDGTDIPAWTPPEINCLTSCNLTWVCGDWYVDINGQYWSTEECDSSTDCTNTCVCEPWTAPDGAGNCVQDQVCMTIAPYYTFSPTAPEDNWNLLCTNTNFNASSSTQAGNTRSRDCPDEIWCSTSNSYCGDGSRDDAATYPTSIEECDGSPDCNTSCVCANGTLPDGNGNCNDPIVCIDASWSSGTSNPTSTYNFIANTMIVTCDVWWTANENQASANGQTYDFEIVLWDGTVVPSSLLTWLTTNTVTLSAPYNDPLDYENAYLSCQLSDTSLLCENNQTQANECWLLNANEYVIFNPYQYFWTSNNRCSSTTIDSMSDLTILSTSTWYSVDWTCGGFPCSLDVITFDEPICQ